MCKRIAETRCCGGASRRRCSSIRNRSALRYTMANGVQDPAGCADDRGQERTLAGEQPDAAGSWSADADGWRGESQPRSTARRRDALVGERIRFTAARVQCDHAA
jgi:hypothetical protein